MKPFTLSQHLTRNEVNVKDFGAIGDGVADDTVALQAAINRGGRVKLPNGTYRTTAPLVIANQVNLVGDAGSVVILLAHNGNGINITGPAPETGSPAITIDGLLFDAAVAQTVGSYIELSNSVYHVFISRCRFNNPFNGIHYTGLGQGGFYVTDCQFWYVKNIGLLFDPTNPANGGGSGFDIVLTNLMIFGVSNAVNAVAGVKVTSAGDITLRHVTTVYTGIGLWVGPTAGKRVQLMMVEHCFFDSGTNWGVFCVTNGGRIDCIKFVNVWSATSSGGGGYYFGTSSAAPYTNNEIRDVTLIDCVGSNNLSQQGFRVGPNCTSFIMMGCSASANTLDGIQIDADTSNFTLIGNRFGPCGEMGGNGGRGISIMPGVSNNYVVTGNRTYGNTGTNMVDGGTGVNKAIANNI